MNRLSGTRRQTGSIRKDEHGRWKLRWREPHLNLVTGKWKAVYRQELLSKSFSESEAKSYLAKKVAAAQSGLDRIISTPKVEIPRPKRGELRPTGLPQKPRDIDKVNVGKSANEIKAPKWLSQPLQASGKSRQYGDVPEGEWPTCTNVTLKKGMLYCDLDMERTYSLTAAHKERLHISFANADSVSQIIDFIGEWGPLYLTEEMMTSGEVANSLEVCRNTQNEMRAVLDVLAAFKSGISEREAIVRLIEVENSLYSEEKHLLEMAESLGISGSVANWAKGLDSEGIREAMNYLLNGCVSVLSSLRLSYGPGRSERQVRTTWHFGCLEEAMWWMIWFDEFIGRPIDA